MESSARKRSNALHSCLFASNGLYFALSFEIPITYCWENQVKLPCQSRHSLSKEELALPTESIFFSFTTSLKVLWGSFVSRQTCAPSLYTRCFRRLQFKREKKKRKVSPCPKSFKKPLSLSPHFSTHVQHPSTDSFTRRSPQSQAAQEVQRVNLLLLVVCLLFLTSSWACGHWKTLGSCGSRP